MPFFLLTLSLARLVDLALDDDATDRPGLPRDEADLLADLERDRLELLLDDTDRDEWLRPLPARDRLRPLDVTLMDWTARCISPIRPSSSPALLLALAPPVGAATLSTPLVRSQCFRNC